MTFRRVEISTADDEISRRQALQRIATEASVANSNMPLLQVQAKDDIQFRQALQAISTTAKTTGVQNSADRNNEPVDAIDGVGGRGILQRLSNDFENQIL